MRMIRRLLGDLVTHEEDLEAHLAFYEPGWPLMYKGHFWRAGVLHSGAQPDTVLAGGTFIVFFYGEKGDN